jgi:hypothetical protein
MARRLCVLDMSHVAYESFCVASEADGVSSVRHLITKDMIDPSHGVDKIRAKDTDKAYSKNPYNLHWTAKQEGSLA